MFLPFWETLAELGSKGALQLMNNVNMALTSSYSTPLSASSSKTLVQT